jgi:tetratricopeptide (TPR) repeat protein
LWSAAEEAGRRARWDDAEAALAAREWYRPHDSQALWNRAICALKRRDQATAMCSLSKIDDHAPEGQNARYLGGMLLKEQFRLGEAEAEFRRCIAIGPDNVRAWRELITVLGVERREAEQEKCVWDLLCKTNDHIEALRWLAHGAPVIPAGALGKTADEGSILTSSLRANPNDPHLRPPLAFFFRGRGDLSKAKSLLGEQLAQWPGDEEAQQEWVACLLDEGELDKAQARLARIQAPGARWWKLRGELLSMRGDHDEALQAFQEAVRRAPRDSEAHYRLGQALRAAGRAEEARHALLWHQHAEELKAVVATIPDDRHDPKSLLRAGRLCVEMHRLVEARGWYAEALRGDPNCAEARAELARIGPSQ